MASKIEDIANSVKTLIPLNVADANPELPKSSNVVVAPLPNLKKEAISETTVTISPGAFEIVDQDRDSDYVEYTIYIGVARSISQTDTTTLFAAIEGVQTIQDAVASSGSVVQAATDAEDVRELASDPLFDASLLRDQNIFLSVSSVRYRFRKVRS